MGASPDREGASRRGGWSELLEPHIGKLCIYWRFAWSDIQELRTKIHSFIPSELTEEPGNLMCMFDSSI